MVIGGKTVIETPGPYTGPYVYQQLQPLPDYQGNLPVIGSWLGNGYARGSGIREDTSPLTRHTSRFVPHLFAQRNDPFSCSIPSPRPPSTRPPPYCPAGL